MQRLANLINITNLSSKQLIIIAMGISAFIFLLAYFCDLKDINFKIYKLQQKKLQLERSIKIEKINNKKLAGQQMQLKNTRAQYMTNLNKFHDDFSEADILNTLSAIAAKSGIAINSIMPVLPQKQQNGVVYSLDLVLLGTYRQLNDFNSLLHTSNYPLLINNFTLQMPSLNLGPNQIILWTARVEVYQFENHIPSPNNDKHNYANKLADNQRDPFAFDTSKSQQHSLNEWNCHELIMLGSIQQNDKTWAVITDPLHNIYHAEIGTKIGINSSKILKITPTLIITENPSDNIYAKN